MRKEQRGRACRSILYRKEVSEMLKRRIMMCGKKESIRFLMSEKERLLCPMGTRFFRTSEDRNRLRVFQMFAD